MQAFDLLTYRFYTMPRLTNFSLRRSPGSSILVATAFIAAFVCLTATTTAHAGDRLLATGGVSQIEGAAGGGLVPWAVIAGYGTRDQIAVTAFHTNIDIDDFGLKSSGVAVGLNDRVELSLTRQLFSLGTTAPGQSIRQDIVGAKIRIAGDAVFDQDSWPISWGYWGSVVTSGIAINSNLKRPPQYCLLTILPLVPNIVSSLTIYRRFAKIITPIFLPRGLSTNTRR